MRKIFLILISLSLFTYTANAQKLVILHTNDMHSMLTGFGPESEYSPMTLNDDATRGGFARLATIYKQEKQANPKSTLIVDAGDFLMGSIFHAGEPETAFQISLMQQIGYDVITLGNHEFDFGPAFLAKILNMANSNGTNLPIVASNIEFSTNLKEDSELKKLYENKTITPYHIIEKNGLKIGIIGIVGIDADDVAPNAKPVVFTNQIKAVKKLTTFLKTEKKVDIVICLSHSGFYPDGKGGYEGEDLELAKKVKNLDVIISGHTHVKTKKAIKINNTLIVQTGSYAKNVGRLEIDFKNGKISSSNFSLIAVDDKVLGDENIHQQIEEYKEIINTKFFKQFGLDFSKPIAETDFNLLRNSHITKKKGNVGQFLTDAVLFYINKNAKKADVIIAASGLIREKIMVGKITPADIFRVAPLGIGNSEIPGYPLSKIYLTGRELKKLGEVIVKAQNPGDDSYINYSGMKLEIDYSKGFLKKVQKVFIADKEIDISKEAETLYSVAATSYLLAFIGEIKKISKGLIKIYPKDKNGKIITDMSTRIIDFDASKEGIQEGKIWLALVEYLQSFEDTNNNGIPEIPAKYQLK